MAEQDKPPVLIRHPNEGFRTWHIREIYTPGMDAGHVPNVDDLVIDWQEGFYRVVDVDNTTGISQLTKWNLPRENESASNDDILLGSGPGTITESYRVYLDDSVTPHTLAVDGRLHIYTTTARSAKIFRGNEVGERGKVISAMYDQSGNFMGEDIPLELVAMPEGDNRAIRAPAVGYTNTKMKDGEVVSLVVYDDAGEPISVNRLLVKNTAYIRTTDASMRYIVDVSVETPFLSASDPNNIEYPINMPVANLNLMGVVTYSDGSQRRLAVDGTKFSMYGLDNYIATIQGQKIPLVLTYRLGPDEYNYISEPTPERTISKRYTATTLKADGAYSVKLFAYPVWQSELTGYRMEYFLYTLEREDLYNVTNLVQMTSDSRSFDPLLYGTKQKISVAVDLKNVDPRFAAYRHVQTFEITLRHRGDDQHGYNWTVGFSPNQEPPYGEHAQAFAQMVNTGNWKLDVSAGCTTVEEWLDTVFYRTQPLYDPVTETQAPAPNFFVLVVGSHRIEVPLSMWNKVMTVHEMPAQGGLVYLEFLRRGAVTDLQLGVSGMIVHRQQEALA